MAETNVQLDSMSLSRRLNWGAVWAGVFAFLGIWFVFGALCLAIFANSTSFGLALSIWGTVLTIIAMFVAGRLTGQLSGSTNSREGMMPGMVMFGLAATSGLLIVVCGSVVFGGVHGSLLDIFSDFGWAIFVGLFVGWLAAMGGASSAHKELPHPSMQQQVRHA